MSARPSGSRARAAAASSTARRGIFGVVEHQQRRSVARAGLGDGRQRGLGDLATAGVEDRGALALDLGRELGHQPRLADPRRPPDHHADDPALARLAPARAQPAKLALAPGEQRRAALELHRQLDDRRRCVEARVLGEDLLLQALELGARLDPDLLDQGLARLAVGIERLRLAPVAIEGEHALRVQALSQRLLGDQRLEPGDRLGVAPGGEIGVDRQLERPQVKLLEAADLGAREGLGGDVGERGAAPQLERGAGRPVYPTARPFASGLLDQLLEAQGVDRAAWPGAARSRARGSGSRPLRGPRRAPCAGARRVAGRSWRRSAAGRLPRARRSAHRR